MAHGVVHQHAQDLQDAGLVSAGGRRSSGLRDDGRPAAGCDGLHLARGIGRELAELDLVVRDREAAGVEPREVEQIGRELREPLHLLAHRLEELAALLLGEAALREQLEVAAERRQRRAQLVRRVGDELATRAVERVETRPHLLQGAREVADLVTLVVDDRISERSVRDAIGGSAQAGESPREGLGGQRSGHERDGEGQRTADHEPSFDCRDLLLNIA